MVNNPVLIAEIGCNHMGQLEIAHEMIKNAVQFCQADIIKFQKRTPKELLSKDEYISPHPEQKNSFGNTYGEHREYLEFTIEEHKQLKEWCDQQQAVYSCSVWDMTAAKEISSLNPPIIKIPSASNLDFEMLNWLAENYMGELHLSLGMTTQKEEEQIVKAFCNKNRNKDLILFACTSGYPLQFEEVCLLEISRLREKFGNVVKSIGFSGHHLGIAVDIAALTLGATHFERHFTLNRTWKGTDHAASLEPDGLRKLKRDLLNVSKALTYKDEDILEVEKQQREKLKRKV
jgi:sialic acid synthase